jgi:hypothetical protein
MIVRNFSSFFLPAIALLCMTITLPQSLLAQGFEGEITMQMSAPMLGAQKIDILYSIKGSKVRQTADDPKQGKIDVYTDMKAGTQIIVQEAQKQGMEIDQSVIDSAMKSMKMPVLVPKATGKKEKIGDYNCEVYSMAIDTSQEMMLWLTKDLPKNVAEGIKNCTDAGMKSTGVKSDALMAMFNNGYAQIRMEVKMSGVTQFTNVYVKAEPKKISDDLFVVPSDVKVMKFDPATMGGAGGQ